MNERGFFSLIGICFLLVAAIFVKGLQEYEANYYNIARDFKTEMDLQNIADSALIEAVELIQSGEVTLQGRKYGNRKNSQYPVPLKLHYNADVQVFYEYGNFRQLTRKYSFGEVDKDVRPDNTEKKGVILMSVASRDSDKMIGKIYCRSLGYFFTDENETKYIHFMKSLN